MTRALSYLKIKNHHIPYLNIKWADIPRLAVITGVNGCGKTKLLEAINLHLRGVGGQFEVESDLNLSLSEFGYIPWQQNLGGFERGYYADFQSSFEGFVNKCSSGQLRQNDARNWNFYELLKERIGEEILSKPVEYFNLPTFREHFSEVWAYSGDVVLNKHIGQLFITYMRRLDEKILKSRDPKTGHSLTDVEIRKEIGNPPWEIINQLFERYKFKYRITQPTRYTDPYDVQFFLVTDKNVSIKFQNLSSGEQMIVTLILWSFDEKLGELKKLLILDEPDAHLHPEMARMFKEILSEIVVGEFDIQVIFSTHSPTTLCWMDEPSIFLMEPGKDIRKVSRQRALETLTSGLLLVHKAFKIVLVEDKDDEKFHQKIFDEVVRAGKIVDKVSLIFRSVRTSVDEGGGKDVVIKACSRWKEITEKTDITGLLNGMVDKDEDSEDEFPSIVKCLSRYSFENYLADPLVLFTLLVDTAHEETASFAATFGFRKGENLKFKNNSLKDPQKIADFVLDKLLKAKVANLSETDLKTRSQVTYLNGISVKLPRIFLKKSGKDVVLKFYKDSFEKIAARINPHNLTEMMIETHLIPNDLIKVYQQIVK